MPADKLVSAILPAYNAANFIQKTIDSITAQTYANLEIIIVDDGSQDDTAEIVMYNLQKDKRIKFFRQPNMGVSAARNLAIEHSEGEFIAPCDADDIWHPHKIEKQMRCITEADDNIGLVYVWTERIDEYDQVISPGKKYDIQGNVIKPLLFTNFVGGGSTPLIKRRCIDTVGNYDLDFKAKNCQGAEDWDLYLRIAGSFQFKLVPLVLLKYRITKNGMTSNKEEMVRSIELANERAKRTYYRIYPEVFRKKQSMISVMKSRASNIRGEYTTSLKFIYKAILQNPVEIVNPQVLRLVTKNLLQIYDPSYYKSIADLKHYKVLIERMNAFYDLLFNRHLSKLGVVVSDTRSKRIERI